MISDNCDENPKQHPKYEWPNHKPTKLTVAIAGLIIYGFFVLIDAHEIWPSWPLIAVGIGIPVTVAVLYLEAFVTDAISFDKFLKGSGVILVAGVLIYFFAPRNALVAPPPPIVVMVPVPAPPISGAQPRTYKSGPGIPFEDDEVHGVLKPANEPTPPNGCDRAHISAGALKVLIGDNAITHNGFGSFTAIGIKACSAISMERRLDGIFVNASLYDPEKQAVVSIRDNQIAALNGENYTARQSRDESRFTVRNARGTELFYIRYLNPTTVQFRGFLACDGTRIVRVQDGQPIPGIFMSNNCFENARVGIQIGKP